MATKPIAMAPKPSAWRIVPREINPHGDKVFDIFHGEVRRAWGIKDEASAHRWLRRLASATPTPTTEPPETPQPPHTPEDSDEDNFVPPRVWWNES